MGLLDRLGGRRKVVPLDGDAPPGVRAAARRLLEDFFARTASEYQGAAAASVQIDRLLTEHRELQAELLRVLVVPPPWLDIQGWRGAWARRDLLSRLLRRRLPIEIDELPAMVDAVAAQAEIRGGAFVGFVERTLGGEPPEQELATSLDSFSRALTSWLTPETAETRKLRRRIEKLLGQEEALTVGAGDGWGDALLADLEGQPEAERAAWIRLLEHAAGAKGARASKKWRSVAAEQIDGIGRLEVERRLETWFGRIEKPQAPIEEDGWSYTPALSEPNETLAKGLVWCASILASDRALRAAGQLADLCFTKIPMVGAVSHKLGNACVYALGASGSAEGIAWLARLRASVKYRQARRLISKALASAADSAGVAASEIDELAVPSFGLEKDGIRRQSLGEHIARLEIDAGGAPALRWESPGGRILKGVPSAVRRDHPAELAELRAELKAIKKLLPGQRHRLERLLVLGHGRPYPVWRERYLEHPLVSALARRLIWHFRSDAGSGERRLAAWLDGRLVEADDSPLALDGADLGAWQVSLWHPLGFPVETVRSWRDWLLRHAVTQPFKQAHREIYVLTDAELETEIYSNRFAAHILRQHQFAALAQARGWQYSLQGDWDSHNVPRLELPEHRLTAEYWVDPAAAEQQSGNAIYLYVATDQVRFTAPGGRTVRLSEVPALVFSEVLRDIDLFVSVCSVGTDPTWSDGGEREFDDYWTAYAFGELNATALTRRELLRSLLPRLSIADRCRLEERELVIAGNLRTYRVHLGSGNVKIDDNGQYLCIVPGRGARGASRTPRLVLPFEGDELLAVILSKALMLAADDRIEDKTITRQLRS